jgi:hypothetical protein
MITERIMKEEPYDSKGRWRSRNMERTVVTMTRDEAARLICELTKMAITPNGLDVGPCSFPDGLWEEKGLSFVVVDEPTFIRHRQELRDEQKPPNEE